MTRGTLVETIDRSITQTLGRSLMTSATTLIVMVPLLIMAGSAIRVFILPLMVGILAGTYSSICVCSPLYYEFSTAAKVSTYERQVKLAKKQAKKDAKAAKKLGKPVEEIKAPADDAAVSEAKEEAKADAKAAEARAEEARAAASEAEEAAAAEAGEAARAEAAEAKKPEKKKPADEQRRSKRYVKGNKKQVEPKEEDDSFRL